MAHSEATPSVQTRQIELYQNYIRDVSNGQGSFRQQEYRRDGPYRYSLVTSVETEIFSYYLLRICSFNTDLNSFTKYSVVQLAKDGFFNTQTGKEVKCYSCGLLFHLETDQWNPLEIHRSSNMQCQHIQRVDENNVTSGSVTLGVDTAVEFASSNSASSEQSHALSDLGPQVQAGRTGHPGGENGRNESLRDHHKRNSVFKEDRPPAQTRNVQRQVLLKDYRLELCRLQSFEHWPSNAAVKAKDLANAGFYYMGTDDRVQCAFCRGILRNWEQEDQSLVEHRRHFPACPFLDDRASVGNIPLEEENESVCTTIDMREGDDETARDQNTKRERRQSRHLNKIPRPVSPQKVEEIMKSSMVQAVLKIFLDIPETVKKVVEKRLHSEGTVFSNSNSLIDAIFEYQEESECRSEDAYSSTEHSGSSPGNAVTSQCGQVDDIDYRKESERLKSFANWPSYVTAQPEELAKCGFYYLGPDDRVQCAFCKGILRCWEPADTPMGEHRRHFPECPFLTDQQSVGNIPLRDQKTKRERQRRHLNEPPKRVNPQKIEEIMKSFMVQTVLKMCVGTPETVKKVVEERLRSEGIGFSSVTALIDAVYSWEDRANSSDYDDYVASQEIPENMEELLALNDQLKEERLCKVCRDEPACIVFLRCGHLVCCDNCSRQVRTCPVCRNPIVGTILVDL